MTTNTEAVEKLAGVVFKTYHPSNMCAQDWDSGAVLGGGNSYRKDMLRIADKVLAAIQADPLEFVKPKPLEFVHGVAESVAGRYVIESVLATDGERRVIWACNPDESDPFYMYQNGIGAKDEEAAQAAAETHRNEMLAKEFAQ